MSQGGEQRRRGAEQEDREEDREEDFFDCQETLGPPDPREEEIQQEAGGANPNPEPDRLTDRTEAEGGGGGGGGGGRGGRGGHQEAVQCDRLQEEQEEQTDRLQEEQEEQTDRLQEDLDSDVENSHSVEFDDDYLREVEKELSEEEKQSRRQQSLTLKEKGNGQFKAGDWSDAEHSYTEALVLCPVCFSRERAILFSNRAAARLHLDLKDQAISDCTRAIELNPDYVRALLRRAELYEQTEKLDEALEDYKKVLDLDPNQTSARQACMRLPQQIQERNEKLKEEMISKLKDLGNMVLRPFGLSTNNFQVNQDQSSGSYSINFVQNPNNNNR